MYYFVMEATFNKAGSIEQELGAAICFASEVSGRGFQAAVSKSTGIDSANLNRMIKKGGGCSEDMRRRIVSATSKIIPDFPAKTYEDFLALGRWILDGNNPEEWVVPVRGEVSANIPAIKAALVVSGEQSPNISPAPPSTKKIPIVSWVNAGDWSKAVDPFYPGYAEDWIDTAATSNVNAFALVVHGDSMEPEFTEGDVITVDPGRAYTNKSFVVVKNGEEATFKQLILDGQSVFLKPLNERYPIKDVTGIEIRIVGVVVEKRKRY